MTATTSYSIVCRRATALSLRSPVKNASNVRTQYRTRLECDSDDGLFDELDIKIGEYTGRTVTKWQPLEAATAEGETIAVLSGEITLPADSAVMGKSCAISFAVEAVQFNADAKNEIHYPTDAADLKDSLSDGGQVYIYKDFTTDESKTTSSDRTLINNPATIDLEATITVPGSLENSSNWAAIFIAPTRLSTQTPAESTASIRRIRPRLTAAELTSQT